MQSLLATKLQAKAVTIVEAIDAQTFSTKAIVDLIQHLKVADQKVLLIKKALDEKLVKSCANLAKVTALPVPALNPVTLAHYDQLVVTPGA